MQHRAVAQFGSASGWGPEGRRFKSCQPDNEKRWTVREKSLAGHRFFVQRCSRCRGVKGGSLGRGEFEKQADDEAGECSPPQQDADRCHAQGCPILARGKVPRLLDDRTELRGVAARIALRVALRPVGPLIREPQHDEEGAEDGEHDGEDKEGHGCGIHRWTLLAPPRPPARPHASKGYGARMAHGIALALTVDGHPIRVTSPDKPFFPHARKRDLVEYYVAVGDRMIEHLRDRPTALERWPDGVFDGCESFYQKHMPRSAPSFVAGCEVRFPSGRPGRFIAPSTPAVIAWAAQMSTVTFHPWPSTAPATDLPDQLRLDFDPAPGTGFGDAVRAAVIAREVVGEWGWPSYAKTSGGRGVHVYVPLIPRCSFIEVRHAAIAIGREVERRDPALVTMSWWKEERGARVFIDFNQNAQDRTMASAFSVRANDEATVSMPLEWDDLVDCQPSDFTLETVPAMIAPATWSDPWAGMANQAVDLAPALDSWERDVSMGLPELPYPPDFPKMPGEPLRVQPSRRRQG